MSVVFVRSFEELVLWSGWRPRRARVFRKDEVMESGSCGLNRFIGCGFFFIIVGFNRFEWNYEGCDVVVVYQTDFSWGNKPLAMCGDHSDRGTKARILFGTESGGGGLIQK